MFKTSQKIQSIRLRKGDIVSVLTGKDSGKSGKILEVDSKRGLVVVESANMHHRFQKKAPNKAGQKVLFPAPMSAAKVILMCPSCGRATRIGYTFLENGNKQRICKKCGKAI